jgi:hypothetical protein
MSQFSPLNLKEYVYKAIPTSKYYTDVIEHNAPIPRKIVEFLQNNGLDFASPAPRPEQYRIGRNFYFTKEEDRHYFLLAFSEYYEVG